MYVSATLRLRRMRSIVTEGIEGVEKVGRGGDGLGGGGICSLIYVFASQSHVHAIQLHT